MWGPIKMIARIYSAAMKKEKLTDTTPFSAFVAFAFTRRDPRLEEDWGKEA